MKPQISIIVPVYNIETYVERCIVSIIHQSLKNIEIIIVDDGSNDKSGIICDKYADLDSRIIVIHQQNNKGLADARNSGLNIATGEYIMFVDGDDWCEPEFCRIPYEVAEKRKVDFVLFRYDNNHLETNGTDEIKITELSRDQAVHYMYQNQGAMVWNKLYRRSIVQHIRFISGKYYEDGPYTAEVIPLMNDNTVFVDRVLYHWCYRKDSITQTASLRISTDYYEMSKFTTDKLQKMGYEEEAQWSRMEYSWMYLLRYGRKAIYADESIEYLTNLSEPPRHLKWKGRLMFRILKFSPWLFDVLCFCGGKRMKLAS